MNTIARENASIFPPSLSDFAVEDSDFALAIAVLSKRISRLGKEDQDDLYQLLPSLLGGDQEERQSAVATVREILDQEKSTVVRSNMEESPSGELRKWMDFASGRLRDARREAGMTQEALAEASGIPQSYISRLESGQHSPTAKTLESLAKALNVPVSTLDPSAE